jgi:transposase
MSKHRYPSVECKGVDWEALVSAVGGRCLVFAVDVAKHDFVSHLQVKDGEALLRVKWQHPEETPELLAGLGRLLAAGPVEAVMESSGTYGDALRWQLRQRGATLYRVSAKRVHDAAEVFDGVPSLHDPKSAELIARLHVLGHSEAWVEASPPRRALSAQLKMLHQSKARHQQELNRLEALLSRHWPESLSVLDLGSVTLHRLIAAYGGPAQVQAFEGPARLLMQKTGRPGLADAKIEALLQSAGQTLGMPCILEERELLRWQAKTVVETHTELRRIEKLIEHAVADDPALASLSTVVGSVTSAVLLAAQGSPLDYPDANSYVKGLGLNLTERSSGKHKGRLKITKRGPGVARFYLYFAALRLIAHEPVVAKWFQTKTARPGAMKQKHVIELMRKLAKALWHHAHGRLFQAARLFDQHPVTSV